MGAQELRDTTAGGLPIGLQNEILLAHLQPDAAAPAHQLS